MARGCCIRGCPNFGATKSTATLHVFPNAEQDPYRHNQWRQACSNNPKIATKTNHMLYVHYRVCRRHFEKDSMNGDCKRLLNTAVPTLHLNRDDVEANRPEDVPITILHTAFDEIETLDEDADEIYAGSMAKRRRVMSPSWRMDETIEPKPVDGTDSTENDKEADIEWVEVLEEIDDVDENCGEIDGDSMISRK